jgi:hypothetical protein
VRRLTATLLVVGLVSFCAYLLWSLLRNPKTYFVHLTASSDYEPSGGQPLQFAYGDFAAFKRLAPAFASESFPVELERGLTSGKVKEKLRALAREGIREKDQLIVYLAAHGVMRDNVAHLRFEPEEFVPVSEVLEELKASPAGTKLLILDAGQDSYNPRSGISHSAFPVALKQDVNAAKDPALWVLLANSSFERSHVSPTVGERHRIARGPARPNRGNSVFGWFVFEALAGFADEDEDRVVRLDELYAYVQPNVSEWVSAATGKNESQTPLLLNSGDSDEASAAIDLLSIANLPSAEDLVSGEETGEVQSDIRSMALEAVASNAPAEASEVLEKQGAEGSDGPSDEGSKLGEAPGGEKPSDAGATASRADAPKEGLKFRQKALEELAKAWTAAAELDSAGPMPTPSAYAPSIWRALIDRLLWYEYYCAADFQSNDNSFWETAVEKLASFNRSFGRFDSDENIPANGNIVDQLRLARSRLLPPVPLEPGQHVSLAMLESAAQLHGNPPENIDKIIQFGSEYDAAVLKQDDPTPARLNELLTTKADVFKEIANCYELEILDLREHRNVPWHLARMALRARRLGEKAAASLLCGEGWARAAIESGDRLRLEGERLLRDQADQNWEEIAEAKLNEARNHYVLATEELEAVRDISDARSALLGRLPDYVRWAHFGRVDSSAASPKPADLDRALSLISDADKVLSQPGNTPVYDLTNLSSRLREARDSLDEGLKDLNDPWRIETVLRTALPPFRDRRQLRMELSPSGKEDTHNFATQPLNAAAFHMPLVDDRRWSAEKDQIESELELARRAEFNKRTIKLPASLVGAEPDDSPSALAIDGHFNDLFAASEESAFDSDGLADVTTRADALAGLRGNMRDWLLRDAEQDGSPNSTDGDLFSLLNRAAWYDLLVWQSIRSQQALDDASPAEERSLPLARDTYRKLAESIQGQPDLASIADPQLKLEVPREIYLIRESDDEARLRLQIASPTAAEVCLVAEYDSRVLSVEGDGIVTQEQLRESADNANRKQRSSKRLMYPYPPDVLGAPKISLSPGAARDVELTVRRLKNDHDDTKLILKAVSRDSYVRKEVDVGLSGKESFHLAVKALDGLWRERNGGVVLHPLPNQETQFAFMLSNRANVKKTVNVRFIVPERVPLEGREDAMPRGAPVLDEANAILAQYGDKELTTQLITVDLPASGEAVPVKFTPAADQKAPANLLPVDPASPDKPPQINLPHGLIAVIEDAETKRKTLRRVLIEPQPPRHYLSALAEVDSAGEVTITVSATNEALVHPDGIRISAKIDGISDQFDRKLDGLIRSPAYSTTLFGRLAANAPEVLKATIDVAGYPRAFIFRIPRGSARSIEPAANTTDVQILSPQRDKAIKAAPQAVVPVLLQVDAPHDTFSQGSEAQVVVGIDSDRDRGLSDEDVEPRTLRSDRQVNVDAKSLAPDGTLALHTQISDFSLNVAGNASDDPVWVLAQLRVPELTPVSRWVEIKLDGSAPIIERVQPAGRQIEFGKDLEVTISTRDLSRVVKVEAAFETSSAGNGNAEDKGTSWTKAAQTDESGTQWVTQLKTGELIPGTWQYVTVRAEDEVGNVRQTVSDAVQVVDKPTKAEPTRGQLMQSKVADVDGVVLFQGKPLGAAKVEFDPPLVPPIAPVETNDAGQFSFTKVPPGKHKLHARGRKNGYFRNAWVDIEVPAAGSTTPIQVTLNAK